MSEYLYALFTAVASAILLDLKFGDPPNKFHPVAWSGKIINFFIPKLKSRRVKIERLNGILFASTAIVVVFFTIYLTTIGVVVVTGIAGLVVFSALVLKITIAIRGMEKHARAIMCAVEDKNLMIARNCLSLIVRRNTDTLDEQYILSATIECIGESTVDGITSPLFYFSLAGPAGSFSYRIINTLDSMIGYRDDYNKDIGWMSARLDTCANYLPARITSALIVASAFIFKLDWKNSIRVLKRDRKNTSSPNAGYPMSALAGALGIRLEKIGYYSLGDACEKISTDKCAIALSIMKTTALLFTLLCTVPLIVLLSLAGWWSIIFGF